MKILGIDTTTKYLSLGAYDAGRIAEYNLELGQRLSSLLGLTLKRALDSLGWRGDDIDYFACGLGPGSFTGMRIGLAAIKGLAWSLRKPVAGIPTLDIIADNPCGIFRLSQDNAYVIPIIDAKRNLIYTCIYKMKGAMIKRLTAYMLVSLPQFVKKIKEVQGRGKITILGDGIALYRDEILRQVKAVTFLERDYWYPQGRNIVSLAFQRIREKKINNAFEIKPIYLYPKECQIKKQ